MARPVILAASPARMSARPRPDVQEEAVRSAAQNAALDFTHNRAIARRAFQSQ